MKMSRGADTAVDENESCQTLPDDLLERIIARVPFPFIFKARCLSKSWRAKFLPISSQDDNANPVPCSLISEAVGERSSNWESCGPVIVTAEDCFAYNRSSNCWRKMPSLSFAENSLPVRFLSNLQIEGALLYHYREGDRGSVANILTRSWKLLPPCPNTDGRPLCVKLVTDSASETYKVFLICEQREWRTRSERYSVEIYDSESDSWSCKKLVHKRRFKNTSGVTTCTNCAYLNGVLYLLARCAPPLLWAFDVKEETFEELQLDFARMPNLFHVQCLVVCNGDLLMVVFYRTAKVRCSVLKVDLGSLKLVLLSRSPVTHDVWYLHERPVSDGSHIFVGPNHLGRMLAYHVDENEWSNVHVPTNITSEEHTRIASSFRPGSCPFAAV